MGKTYRIKGASEAITKRRTLDPAPKASISSKELEQAMRDDESTREEVEAYLSINHPASSRDMDWDES